MSMVQFSNPVLAHCGSDNGCYAFKINNIQGRKCNTKSVLEPPDLASASRRRNFKSGLSLTEKLASRTAITPTCWLWDGALDAYGYGQIAVPRSSPQRNIKTHRLAWTLVHGPVPHDKHVLHHCDVRNCVNPDHLFLGDQAANMKDAAAKGRLHGPKRRKQAA